MEGMTQDLLIHYLSGFPKQLFFALIPFFIPMEKDEIVRARRPAMGKTVVIAMRSDILDHDDSFLQGPRNGAARIFLHSAV